MKTDNETIADFMDIKVAPYSHYAHGAVIAVVPEEGCIDWTKLTIYCPDSSWDWLMPVVEKIAELPNVYNIEIYPTVMTSIYSDETFEESGGIEATYKAVIEFIKWYQPTEAMKELIPPLIYIILILLYIFWNEICDWLTKIFKK